MESMLWDSVNFTSRCYSRIRHGGRGDPDRFHGPFDDPIHEISHRSSVWSDSRPSEELCRRASGYDVLLTPAASSGCTLIEPGQRGGVPLSMPKRSRRPTRSTDANEQDYAGEKSLVFPGASGELVKPICVAVDVDEVLGSFLETLNKFIAEEYSVYYDVSEYHVYDFMKIWKCSQAEANNRVHAFFESEHFKNGIYPLPGAYQALIQLSTFCNLVVVTSRQHVIKNHTLEWIERNYSGVFKEIHFGNHFALEGIAKPKSEICRSLGAHILIDDNPRYAIECAECGIEVLLFDLHGSYPWSKTPCGPQHPLITRVGGWKEVEQALLARSCVDVLPQM